MKKGVLSGSKLWLSSAMDLMGFGGIEFKEEPNRFYGKFMGVDKNDLICGLNAVHCVKPATPRRVKFWVEYPPCGALSAAIVMAP